jgi:DnaJ-class molecular chaperone
MKSRNFTVILCLVFFASSTLLAQSFQYVGAAKCKICHNKPATGQQYKLWTEELHSQAMKSLSNEKSLAYAKEHSIADPSKEPSCIKCHSTAGGLKDTQMAGITIAEGVSCESCHGPGSAYKTNTIMKDQALSIKNGLILPTKEVCEKCHNKDNPFYKPFNFDEAVKKIAHPNPAKAPK